MRPKYGFGSRVQGTRNYTRFRDELIEPLVCGLEPRQDYDEQYYRVNFTQMTAAIANMEQVVGSAAGVVPVNRVV